MTPEERQQALEAIEGLEIGDCLHFFDKKATDRDREICALFEPEDGKHEIDNAITSEGDDNGAYVLTWSWVSFEDTPLSKTCYQCGADTEKVVEMRDGTKEPLCKTCIEELACVDCGAIEGTEEYGTPGDGFDGRCPNCADKHEATDE